MPMSKCKYKNECIFRDSQKLCHCLNSTYFGARKCPFAKTKEQEIKELQKCCEVIGYNWDDYKKTLKNEVFDYFVYRSIFGGDD